MSITWDQVTPYLFVLFVFLVIAYKLRAKWNPLAQKARGATPQNAGQIAHWILASGVAVGLIYTYFQFTFAKNLMLGVVVLLVGWKFGKLNKPSVTWHWPELLNTAGWLIIGATVLFGPALLGIKTVDQWETGVSCETDSSQPKCETWRKEKAAQAAAEKAKREAERNLALAQRQGYTQPSKPDNAPSVIMGVPACGNGWKTIQLPPKWWVDPAWNEAAATIQWRSIKTHQWEDTSVGGADAMRVCAKYKPYAGDDMLLTWSSYKQ